MRMESIYPVQALPAVNAGQSAGCVSSFLLHKTGSREANRASRSFGMEAASQSAPPHVGVKRALPLLPELSTLRHLSSVRG